MGEAQNSGFFQVMGGSGTWMGSQSRGLCCISRRAAGSLRKPQLTSSWARPDRKCPGTSGWTSATAGLRGSSVSSFSIPRRESSWMVRQWSPITLPPAIGRSTGQIPPAHCGLLSYLLRSALHRAPFNGRGPRGSESRKPGGHPPADPGGGSRMLKPGL